MKRESGKKPDLKTFFCVREARFASTTMFPERPNWETFASATMFPSLARPLSSLIVL